MTQKCSECGRDLPESPPPEADTPATVEEVAEAMGAAGRAAEEIGGQPAMVAVLTAMAADPKAWHWKSPAAAASQARGWLTANAWRKHTARVSTGARS
jgi:hypothetical protein